MTNDEIRTQIKPALQMAKLIVMGLSSGLFFFAVGIFFISSGSADDSAQPLTYIALGTSVLVIIARLIVPTMLANTSVQHIATYKWQPVGVVPHVALKPLTDAGKLGQVLLTKTLLGASMLEGAAIFCLMTYLIELHWINLLVAAGMFVGVLSHLPSPDNALLWIQKHLQQIDDVRRRNKSSGAVAK